MYILVMSVLLIKLLIIITTCNTVIVSMQTTVHFKQLFIQWMDVWTPFDCTIFYSVKNILAKYSLFYSNCIHVYVLFYLLCCIEIAITRSDCIICFDAKWWYSMLMRLCNISKKKQKNYRRWNNNNNNNWGKFLMNYISRERELTIRS